MEKFYDNIDIGVLINEARRLEYPPTLLGMGLQMHMALRGIRCYSIFPGETIPTNGVSAGCSQSTTFAKIPLHSIMQGLMSTT